MKSLIIALWICCMVTSTASAARLYYWTDGQGVKHVSDRPPTDGVGVESEEIKEPKRDGSSAISPNESGALDRLYRQQKAEEAQRDATIQRNRQEHESKVQARKEARERELDLARRDYQFHKAREERLKWYENNAPTEGWRLIWKAKRQEGEAAEQRLRELESQ